MAHGGVPLGEADLAGGVTFLLGAEREGLPAEVERDLEVTIPVAIESLNVAAAGAIALYEWRRQNALQRPRHVCPEPLAARRRVDSHAGAESTRRRRGWPVGRRLQSRLRQTKIASSWPAQGVPSNQP